MVKNLKCIECSSMNEKLYPDLREPPLDTDNCLCSDCCVVACETHIEILEEEIDLVKEQIKLAQE